METIYHNRGDTLTIIIECQKHDGTPLDITGYKFFATFKKKSDTDATDGLAVFKKDWDVHADQTNGKTLFTATSIEMNIDEGIYLGDVQSVAPSVTLGGPPIVDTPAIFNIIIEPTATNRTT
jgi:hypothetical protein